MSYSTENPESSTEALTVSWYYSAVTPSDETDFGSICRAIFVGGAGDVVAVRHDGTAVTFAGVQAGTVLPIACRRVNSTSTTASGIVALF